MDKGFNDEELADIMSEIESLEEDFVQSTSGSNDVKNTLSKNEDDASSDTASETEFIDDSDPNDSEDKISASSDSDNQVDDNLDEISEDDFNESDEPVSTNSQDKEEDELNGVLGELSQMPVEDIAPEVTSKHDDNIHHIKEEQRMEKPHNNKSNQTAMSFHVEGDMKLELSFHIGDQFIGVNITDEGLVVGLDGGAKFTIPVHQESAKKAA